MSNIIDLSSRRPTPVPTEAAVMAKLEGMQRESWYLYDVVFDGEVIVENSITPEFDACRVLLARGLAGKLDIFDADPKKLCMTVDIEKGAKLTVVETRKAGPAFAKWKPLPDCLRAAP